MLVLAKTKLVSMKAKGKVDKKLYERYVAFSTKLYASPLHYIEWV